MNRMRSAFTSSYLVPCALCMLPLLAGCAINTAQKPSNDVFAAPFNGDGGVVIAESALVEGVSRGNAISGTTDDCTGPGLGVVVDGTLGSDRYLFDKNGEPCDPAQTLFDGRSALTKRQTDPAITLNFHDSLGPRPETLRDDPKNLPGLQPIPEIRLKSEILSEGTTQVAANPADIEPAAGPSSAQLGNKAVPAKVAPVKANMPDPVVATLSSWQNQDAVYANRSAEAAEAAERNLNNIVRSSQGTREADEAAKLMAQLRERERQVQEEQRRHAETLERAQKNREVTTAARQQWQQKEQELQNSLNATQQRLAQYEELSKKLAADKANKEKAYQDQISNLTSDLKNAEAQADNSRRQLVLQAAAKIAEAEQLASAARLQEQEIKLREAARLKLEAETMMDRALAMRAGSNVVVNGVGAPPAVPLPLMQTPVAVQANGQTLPDIITSMLNQASPQAGQWKADWQLSAPVQHILKEKWSLTAEAPVQQVLAQLRDQVRATHGIALTFTQFGQSRLLVVTDATPLGIEDAPKD